MICKFLRRRGMSVVHLPIRVYLIESYTRVLVYSLPPPHVPDTADHDRKYLYAI
jgi:hypothetical protein